jgi:hypothetical protein
MPSWCEATWGVAAGLAGARNHEAALDVDTPPRRRFGTNPTYIVERAHRSIRTDSELMGRAEEPPLWIWRVVCAPTTVV